MHTHHMVIDMKVQILFYDSFQCDLSFRSCHSQCDECDWEFTGKDKRTRHIGIIHYGRLMSYAHTSHGYKYAGSDTSLWCFPMWALISQLYPYISPQRWQTPQELLFTELKVRNDWPLSTCHKNKVAIYVHCTWLA